MGLVAFSFGLTGRKLIYGMLLLGLLGSIIFLGIWLKMIYTTPKEPLTVEPSLYCGKLSFIVLGEPLLRFLLVLRSSALGWWDLGPVSSADLRRMPMGRLLNMLWCTIGQAGCALGALRLLICSPDSSTSRVLFLLAPVDYVGR